MSFCPSEFCYLHVLFLLSHVKMSNHVKRPVSVLHSSLSWWIKCACHCLKVILPTEGKQKKEQNFMYTARTKLKQNNMTKIHSKLRVSRENVWPSVAWIHQQVAAVLWYFRVLRWTEWSTAIRWTQKIIAFFISPLRNEIRIDLHSEADWII